MDESSSTNGRVDIESPLNNPCSFADKIPIRSCESFRDALTGNWTDTPLSVLFFSMENIMLLQNAIKRGVYERSNSQYLIDSQSCDELKIIMRSIFLQNSQNLPNNIRSQIQVLNNMVVNYGIEQIYSEAISYLKYKRDASYMYTLLPRPILSSNKNNILELKPFF